MIDKFRQIHLLNVISIGFVYIIVEIVINIQNNTIDIE